MRHFATAIVVFTVALGCGGEEEGAGNGTMDAGDGADANVGPIVHGCPTYPEPTAAPGEPTGGRDYTATAEPLFAAYCTRCHSTTRTGADRNFAPEGLNWDDEASVRAHLVEIRNAIGVDNFMPPSEPMPTCEERLEVVRWIDLGAP